LFIVNPKIQAKERDVFIDCTVPPLRFFFHQRSRSLVLMLLLGFYP
jgi:hypothetical protein